VIPQHKKMASEIIVGFMGLAFFTQFIASLNKEM
jgi:hypothetical protein